MQEKGLVKARPYYFTGLKILVGIASSIILVIVIVAIYLHPRSDGTVLNYPQLELGMARAQVEQHLGIRPDYKRNCLSVVQCSYYFNAMRCIAVVQRFDLSPGQFISQVLKDSLTFLRPNRSAHMGHVCPISHGEISFAVRGSFLSQGTTYSAKRKFENLSRPAALDRASRLGLLSSAIAGLLRYNALL